MSKSLSNFEGVLHAQAKRAKKDSENKAAAAAAASQLDLLRVAAKGRAGDSEDSSSAAATSRDARGELLIQCAAAYQEMAGFADEHAADSEMMREAWNALAR
jgi:hypothetical protein